MFEILQKVKNPRVLKPVQLRGLTSFEAHELKGIYYKIIPSNAKEVFALQMLEHRAEKFAPAEGNGILVTAAALAKFKKSPVIA